VKLPDCALLFILLLLAQTALAQDDNAVEIDLDHLYEDVEETGGISIADNDYQLSVDLGEHLLSDERSLAMQLGDFSALSILERERFGAALDLATLLERLPGVDVRSLGGTGQLSTVTMRGAASGQVLVLLDGQPLSPLQGSDLSMLSPALLQRIEVLRGPQALQFGPGALGGVVNLVTLQPQQETAHVLSYADSGLSFKEYFHEQVKREFSEDTTDQSRDTSYTYAALVGTHGLAGLSLSQSSSNVVWSLGHSRSDNDYSYSRGGQETARRRNAGFSRTELLGNWQTTSAQYRLGFSDLSRGIPGSAEFPTLKAHLDRQALWFQQRTSAGRTALSFQYSHVRDPEPFLNQGAIDNSDLLLHAEHEKSDGNLLWRPRLDYANGDSAQDRLRAGLDISLLEVRQHGEWSMQYGTGLIGSSDMGIDPVASLALRRDFGETAEAYISLSRAVRHPGFEELYLANTGSVRGNPELDAETVNALELGYHRSFSQARLETGVFYNSYEDSIIFAPVSAYLVEARNTGAAHVAGMEVALDWKLTNRLWWTSSAAWLPLAEYASGIPLTGRASLHAVSALQYSDEQCSTSLGVDHSSSIPADLFGNLRTDPRAIVNFELSLGPESRRLSLALLNVLDTAARDAWNYPLPGRELAVTWSKSL
jgi:outer membrane receptor protein involved in Fe transport